jgi:hypothetical protein
MRVGSTEKIIFGPMLYTTNQKYFTDGDIAFLTRSILVTAVAIGDFCHYSTKGELPVDKRQKEIAIEEMVKATFNDMEIQEKEFGLFFDLQPISTIHKQGAIAKFDLPDDTASWVLNITEGEFKTLQQAWRKSGLPVDLFKSFCQNVARPKQA